MIRNPSGDEESSWQLRGSSYAPRPPKGLDRIAPRLRGGGGATSADAFGFVSAAEMEIFYAEGRFYIAVRFFLVGGGCEKFEMLVRVCWIFSQWKEKNPLNLDTLRWTTWQWKITIFGREYIFKRSISIPMLVYQRVNGYSPQNVQHGDFFGTNYRCHCPVSPGIILQIDDL